MFGWLISSCASNRGRQKPSLAQFLQALPSIGTASEFIGKFGEPQSRVKFNHDDPNNTYFPNRYSRDAWKSGGVDTPPDLIDTVPVGTNIFLYNFRYILLSAINPTIDVLLVFIDTNDRILGWSYGKSLVGHESDSRLLVL